MKTSVSNMGSMHGMSAILSSLEICILLAMHWGRVGIFGSAAYIFKLIFWFQGIFFILLPFHICIYGRPTAKLKSSTCMNKW